MDFLVPEAPWTNDQEEMEFILALYFEESFKKGCKVRLGDMEN